MDKNDLKPGDLVTGIDRSYERSIYRYLRPGSFDDDSGIFEFVSLAGNTAVDHLNKNPHKKVEDLHTVIFYSEVRPATWFEIKKSSSHSLTCLMLLLDRLDILK